MSRWSLKPRRKAEAEGDTMYVPSSKDAIKGFIASRGSASRGTIFDYMQDMYGLNTACVRVHLSDLTRAGVLGQRGSHYYLTQNEE